MRSKNSERTGARGAAPPTGVLGLYQEDEGRPLDDVAQISTPRTVGPRQINPTDIRRYSERYIVNVSPRPYPLARVNHGSLRHGAGRVVQVPCVARGSEATWADVRGRRLVMRLRSVRSVLASALFVAAMAVAGPALAVPIQTTFNFVPTTALIANTGDVTTATTITSGAPDIVTQIIADNTGLTSI